MAQVTHTVLGAILTIATIVEAKLVAAAVLPHGDVSLQVPKSLAARLSR